MNTRAQSNLKRDTRPRDVLFTFNGSLEKILLKVASTQRGAQHFEARKVSHLFSILSLLTFFFLSFFSLFFSILLILRDDKIGMIRVSRRRYEDTRVRVYDVYKGREKRVWKRLIFEEEEEEERLKAAIDPSLEYLIS